MSLATGIATAYNGTSIAQQRDTKNSADFLHNATAFLTVSGSNSDRLAAVSHNDSFAIVVHKDNTHAETIILPAYHPSLTCLLGNQSSSTNGVQTKVRPVKLSPDAVNAFYALLPLAEAKKLPFTKGKAFTRRTLSAMASFLTSNAQKQWVFVLCSVGILLPWGTRGTFSGEVEDVAAALIAEAHAKYPMMLDIFTNYDPALGQFIQDNLSVVSPFLPPVPSGCVISATPFLSSTHLTTAEEEGSFSGALAALEQRLNANNKPAPTPPTNSTTSSIPPSIAPPVNPSPPSAPTPTAAAPTTSTQTAMAVAPTAAERENSDVEDILARWGIFCASTSKDDKGNIIEVVPGTVNPELDLMIRRSTKAQRPKKLMTHFRRLQLKLGTSFDYLLRKINWSASSDPTVCAWVMGCQFDPRDDLTAIDDLSHQSMGLTAAQFTLDNIKFAKDRSKTAIQSMATYNTEDLMGLASNDPNREKLQTTTFANTNIANIDAILTCGANLVFLALALGHFTYRGEDQPTFVTNITAICDVCSTAAFQQFLSRSPHRARFCYYVFTQFQTILRIVLSAASDPLAANYTTDPAHFQFLETSPFQSIEKIAAVAVQNIELFSQRAISIPSTPFFESSNEKKQQQKREYAELVPSPTTPAHQKKRKPDDGFHTPAPGKQHTPGSSTPKMGPAVGLVILDKPGRLLGPPRREGQPDLCMVHLRNGKTCLYGDRCTRSHAAFDSWPDSLQKDWKQWVAKTEGASWNTEIAPASLK